MRTLVAFACLLPAFAVAGAAFTQDAAPPDMAGVPGGRFVMGQDGGGEPDEQPSHCVFVKPFLLDRTEVTNEATLGATRHRRRSWRSSDPT